MGQRSYSYLYTVHGAEELARRYNALEKMVEALTAEPETEAALAETRTIMRALRDLKYAGGDALRRVWHAIEWRDSYNGDQGLVDEAIKMYCIRMQWMRENPSLPPNQLR